MIQKMQVGLLWIVAGILIALGGLLVFGDKVSASATCFTVAILLLLIAHIDRLESFKGFGIEAKTRALRETISEAETMRNQIGTLTENLQSFKAEADATKLEMDSILASMKSEVDRAKRMARRTQF
ncbi:MAG TPA: hypothetical protein VNW52_07135 [Burkholderiaceae bacterium]|jgi:hypothetical protein|nr:hypothetical protein [Burkholderiaceae bacterium]